MPDGSFPDVILLRSANEPDRYVRAFSQAGLQARCEPVLTFAFPYGEALRDRLHQRRRFAGIIVTSPRAVRALRRVFDDVGTVHAEWEGTPAYVVGPKTGERIQNLGFKVRGEDCGTAEALVEYLAQQDLQRPLLFLSGDRRRDAVPEGLRAKNVSFEEQVVYETHFRSDLTLPPAESDAWIVFFSPSGLNAVRRASGVSLSEYRYAAIGPTTAKALRDHGLEVEAVADTPSPDGLMAALKDAAHA